MNPANDNVKKDRIVLSPTTQPVLNEVLAERVRQDEKWGEQNWPNFPKWAVNDVHRAMHYGIPTEAMAKAQTESRFKHLAGTYADILIEEVAEAIGAHDDDALREELVQVAAVAVAWIEAIDRRKAREHAA